LSPACSCYDLTHIDPHSPPTRRSSDLVNGGGELIWWDYAGKNALIADMELGQDSDYVFRYFNDMWLPTFAVIWARFERAQQIGFEYNSAPPQFGELKLNQQVDFYLVTANWK